MSPVVTLRFQTRDVSLCAYKLMWSNLGLRLLLRFTDRHAAVNILSFGKNVRSCCGEPDDGEDDCGIVHDAEGRCRELN